MTQTLRLFIGTRTTSSWSLRPWLALQQVAAVALADVTIEDPVIDLDTPDTATQIAAVTPAGTVPVLHHEIDGDTRRIWDSLAICEYLAEQWPDARLWPGHAGARAQARSVVCEMHSGFAALRAACPMNLRRTPSPLALNNQVQADIARIQEIWEDARARFGDQGGAPWLFGGFSIADCFFAPVATRFHRYGVALRPGPQAWVEAILAHRHMVRWTALAAAETAPIPAGYP